MTDNKFAFVNAAGEKVQGPTEAIFPIYKNHADGGLEVIGTGFFVNNTGLFMTAAHVIREPTEGELVIPHLLAEEPGHTCLPRSLLSFMTAKDVDIAVGATPPYYHKTTGKQLSNKSLMVTTNLPAPGDVVACYSFPETIVTWHQDQWVAIVLPRWIEGVAEEYFPNGRDRVMQPGSCYQVKMDIPGGGSGGPVMSRDGMVWGVISSGITGADVTYVAPVFKILDTPTIAFDHSGKLTLGRLRDFMPIDIPCPEVL
jgi:Trypsin-like peptidase domain